MFTFDASALLYAWDNYPIEKFPSLWDWFADKISDGEFTTPQTAFDEVTQKQTDFKDWLKDHPIQKLPLTNDVLAQAVIIKDLLGIKDDKYGGGVGENDIFIIATAMVNDLDLVSNENRQVNPPQKKANYKIPAVCHLPDVDVSCINFLELIKQSHGIF